MSRLAPALAVALLLAAAACAGDDATRGVTLTNDDCVYEGPESVETGIELDIENESDGVGVFELVRIDPTSNDEELQAYIASEQERIDEGAPQGTPGFVSTVLPLEVDPGETSVITAGLKAAHYAILCWTGTPATSIHATPSFEATGP